MRSSTSLSAALLLASLLVACSGTSPSPPEGQSPPPTAASNPPALPLSPAATPPAVPASAPPPAPSASTPVEPAVPAASASAAAAPKAAPLPAVRVVNIGMHIGGGPNDAANKEPIKRSVEPHFDELRRCFALVEEPKKGDFGVDIRIEKNGGKAKISHPRTALEGDGFRDCVVKVFEEIDFLKPKKGTATTVSYSIRFTPE